MSYVQGSYTEKSAFVGLDKAILKLPNGQKANRLFYLALPPTVFEDVTRNIHDACMKHEWVHCYDCELATLFLVL